MSGHSKWSTIKHKKAAKDQRRGKEFAKLIRAIEVAARGAGSAEPADSPSLSLAVQKAKDADVPKDNIERACKRGAGVDADVAAFESAQYEGYGPGGVAVLVDVLTDNRNRTASDVRQAFTRAGGSLAEPGSVAFLFTRRGYVRLPATPTEDDVMLVGLDAGMDDLEREDDTYIAWCEPNVAADLRAAFTAADIAVETSGSTMVPSSVVPVGETADARRILALFDALDDNDDVQEVWANADIADDVLAELDD